MTTVAVTTPAGAVISERCVIAEGPLSRMRGLLGRRDLPRGDGLLLRPASSIHMFFMCFAIDAVFIDRDGTVVRIVENLRPWRMASRRGARAVLELAAGECRRHGLRVGERIELTPR